MLVKCDKASMLKFKCWNCMHSKPHEGTRLCNDAPLLPSKCGCGDCIDIIKLYHIQSIGVIKVLFLAVLIIILGLLLTGCAGPCVVKSIDEYNIGECEYFIHGWKRVDGSGIKHLRKYCRKFSDGNYYMRHVQCNTDNLEGFILIGTIQSIEHLELLSRKPELLTLADNLREIYKHGGK